MCERYFIEFPPQEPLTMETLLEESLALVHPKDIHLHRTVFLIPFEALPEKADKKRIWSRSQKTEFTPATILRRNIRFMIRKTKHFGLLLSQLTWVGLMNFAEKRRVLQQIEDDLRAAALYIIMLKKESNGLTQFINCLHMTGNHEIANIIEAKLELLELNDMNCEQCGFEASLTADWNRHYMPPKKRKTSADSGFDDTDDEEDVETSVAVGVGLGVRKYRCNIRPLDAVDVIAIINGKEDSRYKVELCKCGHYHQFPKWKDVSNEHGSMTKENRTTCHKPTCPSAGANGLTKYFTRKPNKAGADGNDMQQPKQGILSPVAQPVEVGSDLNNGVLENLEFTQPRRSCSHLRLRFSNLDSFAEHPDNVQEEQENVQVQVDDGSVTFKDRLPRFLRVFL